MGGSDAPPLLQARLLHKSYGSVQALRGASFDVAAGEVVALIGTLDEMRWLNMGGVIPARILIPLVEELDAVGYPLPFHPWIDRD